MTDCLLGSNAYLGEILISKKEIPPKRVEFLTDLLAEEKISGRVVLLDGRCFSLKTRRNRNGNLSVIWEVSVLEEGIFAYCVEISMKQKKWRSGIGICRVTK
jgi:hypothetical protein